MSSEIVITHMRHFEYKGEISSSYSASSNLIDFPLLSIRGPPLKRPGYHCAKFLPYWCLFAHSFLTYLLWEMGCTYTVFAIKVHCTIRTYTSMFFFFFYPKMCHHMCKIYRKYSSKWETTKKVGWKSNLGSFWFVLIKQDHSNLCNLDEIPCTCQAQS